MDHTMVTSWRPFGEPKNFEAFTADTQTLPVSSRAALKFSS